MKTYNKSKPLISIHIPKCGGRSLQVVLKQWFGRKYRRHYVNERRAKSPKQHRLTRWWNSKKYIPDLCIAGHFNKMRGFGIEDYYPEVEQFITVVRDPLEMMISNYFHGKKVEKQAGRYWDGKPISFEDEYSDIEDYLHNHENYLLYHMPRDMTLDNYQDIIETYFVYIGITEDLQTSVDRLAQKLGYDSVQVPHKNVSPRDERIPDDIRAKYREEHPLEYAIYDYAVANYKKW